MSKTSENLLKAIAGESLARNKYTFFAEVAEKEGYLWIRDVFLETAGNERAHAQEEFEKLKEKADMSESFSVDPLGDTLANLKAAAAGETHEFTEMYPGFKKIAEEEGDKEVAHLFQEVSEVEEKHAERFNILADLVENDKVFEADKEVEWKCLNCGYVHKGTSAPATCPLCKKPQAWYMRVGLLQ